MSDKRRTTQVVEPAEQAPNAAPRVLDQHNESNASVAAELPDQSNEVETPMLAAAGGALVAHSAASTQLAADKGSYTQRLLAAKAADPSLSIDAAVDQLSDQTSGTQQGDHLRVGTTSSAEEGGKHVGVYIGNSDYETLNDLPGAATDAAGMQSTWSASGYEGTVQSDLDSASMASAMKGGASALGPGDEMLVYYAGHGSEKGLLGVKEGDDRPDLLANSAISGLVSQARSGKFQLKVILDSCYSGSVTDEVRKDAAIQLANADLTDESRQLLPLLDDMRNLKDGLTGASRRAERDAADEESGESGESVEGTRARRLGMRYFKRQSATEFHTGISKFAATYKSITASDALSGVVPAVDSLVETDRHRRVDIVDTMSRMVMDVVRGARAP